MLGLLCVQARVAAAADIIEPPTLQDLQIAGRVLSFQSERLAPVVTVAVVYSASSAGSLQEARTTAGLLVDGLAVGDLVLRPRLVEQDQLARLADVQAIFACSGVDQERLKPELQRRRVLCLTRHLDQVEHGACMVAIRSAPEVSIAVSRDNASRSDVRFATAFLMMVREI